MPSFIYNNPPPSSFPLQTQPAREKNNEVMRRRDSHSVYSNFKVSVRNLQQKQPLQQQQQQHLHYLSSLSLSPSLSLSLSLSYKGKVVGLLLLRGPPSQEDVPRGKFLPAIGHASSCMCVSGLGFKKKKKKGENTPFRKRGDGRKIGRRRITATTTEGAGLRPI